MHPFNLEPRRAGQPAPRSQEGTEEGALVSVATRKLDEYVVIAIRSLTAREDCIWSRPTKPD